ncbi:hypothetical protein R3P38DRAFT_3201944 [Favolaschia claudopus]|uniref:Uncharacterized protein n=1 Tax=Favolaschia claudopus TaxID=2862362 RepID=A0AAW0AW40_9AGAR
MRLCATCRLPTAGTPSEAIEVRPLRSRFSLVLTDPSSSDLRHALLSSTHTTPPTCRLASPLTFSNSSSMPHSAHRHVIDDLPELHSLKSPTHPCSPLPPQRDFMPFRKPLPLNSHTRHHHQLELSLQLNPPNTRQSAVTRLCFPFPPSPSSAAHPESLPPAHPRYDLPSPTPRRRIRSRRTHVYILLPATTPPCTSALHHPAAYSLSRRRRASRPSSLLPRRTNDIPMFSNPSPPHLDPYPPLPLVLDCPNAAILPTSSFRRVPPSPRRLDTHNSKVTIPFNFSAARPAAAALRLPSPTPTTSTSLRRRYVRRPTRSWAKNQNQNKRVADSRSGKNAGKRGRGGEEVEARSIARTLDFNQVRASRVAFAAAAVFGTLKSNNVDNRVSARQDSKTR